MQLLYGPNTGQSNNGCYESKAFDKFYDKARASCPIRRNATAVPRDDAADGSRRRMESAHSRERNQFIRPGSRATRSTRAARRIHLHGSSSRGADVRPRPHVVRTMISRASLAVPGSPTAARASSPSPALPSPPPTCASDPRRVPGRRDRIRSRSPITISIPAPSCRRSSRRCYTYDYLARPAKLVPLTAEALPQITDGGRTYTFKLKKGILFAPDPGIQGQEARAGGRGFRLFAEAPDRPEDPFAVCVPLRRQVPRPRRTGRGGEEERQVRLRQQDPRVRIPSTATRCGSG